MLDEILSSSVELNTEIKTESNNEEVEKVEEAPKVETPKAPEETIEALETLSEKSDDVVPLKKYMVEKNAKRDAEAKAEALEAEIAKLRENPSLSNSSVQVDLDALHEETGVDKDILTSILRASYNMTKNEVKAELEKEFMPKLAEMEQIKREKEQQEFNNKFNSMVEQSLAEMPEYVGLVDKDDLKQWVKSGQYSKLTLPQLIEQKYSKFVVGKKTIESSHASKQVEKADVSKPLTQEQYLQLDNDPELRKEWAESLTERLKKVL
jgi:hypothetical protein